MLIVILPDFAETFLDAIVSSASDHCKSFAILCWRWRRRYAEGLDIRCVEGLVRSEARIYSNFRIPNLSIWRKHFNRLPIAPAWTDLM